MAGLERLQRREPCSALFLICRQEGKDELFVRHMRPCVRGAGMCVCVRVRHVHVSRVCMCARVGRGEETLLTAASWLAILAITLVRPDAPSAHAQAGMRMGARTTHTSHVHVTACQCSSPNEPALLLGAGRGMPVLAWTPVR
jgi:hypothetical protein